MLGMVSMLGAAPAAGLSQTMPCRSTTCTALPQVRALFGFASVCSQDSQLKALTEQDAVVAVKEFAG